MKKHDKHDKHLRTTTSTSHKSSAAGGIKQAPLPRDNCSTEIAFQKRTLQETSASAASPN